METLMQPGFKTTALLVIGTFLALPATAADVTIKRSKSGYYKAVTTYPDVPQNSPFAKLAQTTYVQWARSDQSRFVNETEKTLKDVGKPTAAYEYLAKGKITYNSPRLMSLQFDVMEYTGGAHPNHASP